MRSHTVSAEGGAAAVLREPDSFDSHAFDTIKGGAYLGDQDVIEVVVREDHRVRPDVVPSGGDAITGGRLTGEIHLLEQHRCVQTLRPKSM